MTRSVSDVAAVLRAADAGVAAREIAASTGVPATTVRRWIAGGPGLLTARNAVEHEPEACPHRAEVPVAAYAYVLGAYLGDGTLCRNGTRALRLEVACCGAYPQLIDEIAQAVQLVLPVTARRRPHGDNCVMVSATSVHWRCLIPQHAPGRKHDRPIALEAWQEALVRESPEPFVRGLLHSDGWRGVNRVGRYAYIRYQFTNRSADIRMLFAWGCELVGVSCRRTNEWTLAVSRRADVERLDEFVGPKS